MGQKTGTLGQISLITILHCFTCTWQGSNLQSYDPKLEKGTEPLNLLWRVAGACDPTRSRAYCLPAVKLDSAQDDTDGSEFGQNRRPRIALMSRPLSSIWFFAAIFATDH